MMHSSGAFHVWLDATTLECRSRSVGSFQAWPDPAALPPRAVARRGWFLFPCSPPLPSLLRPSLSVPSGRSPRRRVCYCSVCFVCCPCFALVPVRLSLSLRRCSLFRPFPPPPGFFGTSGPCSGAVCTGIVAHCCRFGRSFSGDLRVHRMLC